MRTKILGLDHVVLRVADLDRAADDFEGMGFTLSPRGKHTLGTENRCLMFGFDYLELLCVPPGVSAPFYAEGLAGNDEGLTGLALKTEDAEGLRAVWEKAGIQPEPVLSFSRPVEVAPGLSQDARFRVVAVPPERSPGGRTFACQHFTPELVWRPGYRRHRNHVTGINKIVIQSDDPQAAAALWGRLIDIEPYPIPGGYSITTGAAPIVILSTQGLRKQLPGVKIDEVNGASRFAVLYLSTSEPRETASILGRAGRRPVALPDGSTAVEAAEAHGITLVFK